jgi:hypothetical protein
MQGREIIPQTFVISRDGRVVKRFVGFNATQNPRLIGQAIEAALRHKVDSVIESTTLRAKPTAGMIARNNTRVGSAVATTASTRHSVKDLSPKLR